LCFENVDFDPKKNFGLFINFHFLSIAPVQYSLVISRVNVKFFANFIRCQSDKCIAAYGIFYT
jgi:hypothetical protein